MRPTRFYSDRQEKAIAKAVNGKQTANSGAPKFSAGDVIADDWLFEAKTTTKEQRSFSIKRDWIDRNREEAFQRGKHNNAIVFDFGDFGERFYVIDERTFLKMKEALDGLS